MLQIKKDDTGMVMEVFDGSKTYNFDDLSYDEIAVHVTLEEAEYYCLIDIPEIFTLRLWGVDLHNNLAFNLIDISKRNDQYQILFDCILSNETLKSKWDERTIFNALKEEVKSIDIFDVKFFDENGEFYIYFIFHYDLSLPLRKQILNNIDRINNLVTITELRLEGFSWKKEYETNEAIFSKEVIAPLLRKMNFSSVQYVHGNDEFGRDFTFSEKTKFGNVHNYGLQVKAGDVSGGVNSDIDILIGQIDDAFNMCYFNLGSKEPRYISTYIIAISGRFTKNAKEKIKRKISDNIIGSIIFLDKERILELTERYWF